LRRKSLGSGLRSDLGRWRGVREWDRCRCLRWLRPGEEHDADQGGSEAEQRRNELAVSAGEPCLVENDPLLGSGRCVGWRCPLGGVGLDAVLLDGLGLGSRPVRLTTLRGCVGCARRQALCCQMPVEDVKVVTPDFGQPSG